MKEPEIKTEQGRNCAVCGGVGILAPVPTAVTVPVMLASGENLEVPGVYPLCTRCRRTIAFAERHQDVGR